MSTADREQQQLTSWTTNALAWTNAVREGRIASRRAATDAAIVDVLTALHPRRALDLGCGEGWLTRALHNQGIETVGVDGSAALIQQAQAAGGGSFRALTYDAILAEPHQLAGPYDVVVCNFSLLGETITPLLAALRTVLAADGAIVVQTVHPWSACGESPYVDGWRTERFTTFGDEQWDAMPWYFRTLSSWLTTWDRAQLHVHQCIEPLHPTTQQPLSLIFVARPKHSVPGDG
jgi:2-polyprenyl-3-methyl-5-hydroxy-6-metoxy-1,4-benzoquinol methylase